MKRSYWILIVVAAAGVGLLPFVGIVLSIEGDLEFSRGVKDILAVLFSIAMAAIVIIYSRHRH